MTATDKRPYPLAGLADSSQHVPGIEFVLDGSSGHIPSTPGAEGAHATTQPPAARAIAHAPQATQKVQRCSVQYRAGNQLLEQQQLLSKKQCMIKNFFANKSAKSAQLSVPNQISPASRSLAASYVYTVSQRSGPISDGNKPRFAEPPAKPQRNGEKPDCSGGGEQELNHQQLVQIDGMPHSCEKPGDQPRGSGKTDDQHANLSSDAVHILEQTFFEAKRNDPAFSKIVADANSSATDFGAVSRIPATHLAPMASVVNNNLFQHVARKAKPVATKSKLAVGAPAPPPGSCAAASKELPVGTLGSRPSVSTIASQYLSTHKVTPRFAERYTIGDELGSGGFGFVVSAIKHPENVEVAVKFICKDKVPMHAWTKDATLGLIPTEIFVLRRVDHSGIIRFIEYFEDPRFFYLVMELHGTPWNSRAAEQNRLPAPKEGKINQDEVLGGVPPLTSPGVRRLPVAADAIGSKYNGGSATVPIVGPANNSITPSTSLPPNSPRKGMVRRSSCDLFECIEQHRRFSEANAQYIFVQLVDSVNYLKSVGICHRDLKDENIVIDKDLMVKLVDFGSAVVTTHKRVFNRFYGTISYASPEILRGESYCAEAAEIWSLGILLYTLLYGEVPFSDPKQAIWDRYTEPKIKISAVAIDLLDRMLDKDAARRPDIGEVRRHPWLSSVKPPSAIKQAQPASGNDGNDGKSQARSGKQPSSPSDYGAKLHSPVPRPVAPRSLLACVVGGEEQSARDTGRDEDRVRYSASAVSCS